MTSADGAPPDDVPAEIAALIGVPQYEQTADFDVERSYTYNTCAATQNGNPIYWDDEVAQEITGGPIAPPTTLSLWMRPHYWQPGAAGEQVALQVHFDMKASFDLPEAVMTDNTLILHDPVRPGDRISYRQVLRSVSGPKTTKLGTGRFWVIDVEYHNQNGDLVGIESYTGFGYRRANDGAGA
jgi:acyl dehydratase